MLAARDRGTIARQSVFRGDAERVFGVDEWHRQSGGKLPDIVFVSGVRVPAVD